MLWLNRSLGGAQLKFLNPIFAFKLKIICKTKDSQETVSIPNKSFGLRSTHFMNQVFVSFSRLLTHPKYKNEFVSASRLLTNLKYKKVFVTKNNYND